MNDILSYGGGSVVEFCPATQGKRVCLRAIAHLFRDFVFYQFVQLPSMV